MFARLTLGGRTALPSPIGLFLPLTPSLLLIRLGHIAVVRILINLGAEAGRAKPGGNRGPLERLAQQVPRLSVFGLLGRSSLEFPLLLRS